MKHRCNRTIPAVLSVIAVMLSTVPASGDSLDASIRQLDSAVTPQRRGEHLNLLFALRQLHTPTMRPLFYKLVQHEGWPVQVHAVLGLAELSDDKQIDPWLVRQMNPHGHEALIANALDLNLLGLTQMRELLRHDELGPMPRLLLLAELISLDEPAPLDQLEKLCAHADFHVSALAAALLVQIGDASKFSAVRERLASTSKRERNADMQWMFEAIRQYKLTAMLPWVKQTLRDEQLDPPAQFAGVFALAALGDPDVMEYWTSGLGTQPRHAQLIRYALLLLSCADTVPVNAFDQLPTDDTLLKQIALTGRAVRSGQDTTTQLMNLLALSHRKSTDLAMPHVKHLPVEQASQVYVFLVDRLAVDEDELTAEQIAVAVQAASLLVKSNPTMIIERLLSAKDDSVQQQAILLGLMDAHSIQVGEGARNIRRIGAGRADSLALLLMAKNLPTLDTKQVEQLGLIASGGGRVSAVLQTQAAWLYIQHTGNVEKALSRLFPGS